MSELLCACSHPVSSGCGLQVGAILAYILDAFRQKELALSALWASLALSNMTNLVAILTSSSPDPLMLKLAMIMVCAGAPPLRYWRSSAVSTTHPRCAAAHSRTESSAFRSSPAPHSR